MPLSLDVSGLRALFGLEVALILRYDAEWFYLSGLLFASHACQVLKYLIDCCSVISGEGGTWIWLIPVQFAEKESQQGCASATPIFAPNAPGSLIFNALKLLSTTVRDISASARDACDPAESSAPSRCSGVPAGFQFS